MPSVCNMADGSKAMAINPKHHLVKNPPADAEQRITEMSAKGASKRGIALNLGVSIPTLNRWMEEDEKLQAAFDAGREKEHGSLFNALFVQATEKGNVTAAIFLLKSRHNYVDNGGGSEAQNKVSITFNLPGADKLEAVVKSDKKKVIDHE